MTSSITVLGAHISYHPSHAMYGYGRPYSSKHSAAIISDLATNLYCPSYIPQGFTVATDCIHQIKPERSLLVWFNPTNKKTEKELEDQVFLWIKHQDDCVLFISRIVRWGHCSSDRRPETNFTIYSLPEKRRKGLWCLISMVERTVFLVRCNFALLLSSWTIRDVNILQPTTKIIIRK